MMMNDGGQGREGDGDGGDDADADDDADVDAAAEDHACEQSFSNSLKFLLRQWKGPQIESNMCIVPSPL